MRILVTIDPDEISKQINDEIEWLSTTEGDEIECIGIELLKGILEKQINVPFKIGYNDLG